MRVFALAQRYSVLHVLSRTLRGAVRVLCVNGERIMLARLCIVFKKVNSVVALSLENLWRGLHDGFEE